MFSSVLNFDECIIVAAESAVFCRRVCEHSSLGRMGESLTFSPFTSSQYISNSNYIEHVNRIRFILLYADVIINGDDLWNEIGRAL